MATPPTLVAFAQVEAAVNTGVNVTTASLSWQTGDTVVAFGYTVGGAAGEEGQTISNTGTGISFGAAKQQVFSDGTECGMGCWAAVTTGASSGTFSFNYTHAGATGRDTALCVFIWRGGDGIGNSAVISATTTKVVALTPTAADSAICWATADWEAAATVTETPTSTSHNTSTPGPQALRYAQQIASAATYYAMCLDDQTSAGSVNYGITGSGVGPFIHIAIEVKGAAVASSDSGPNYAGAASDMANGSGSWTNPTNAQGAANAGYAVWTAP